MKSSPKWRSTFGTILKIMSPSRAVLAGLLVALGFPPLGFWPLAFVGFVLMARPLLSDGLQPRATARWLFAFHFTMTLAGFYWLAHTMTEFGHFPWALSIFVMLFAIALVSLFPALMGWLWAKFKYPRYRPLFLWIFLIFIDTFDPRLFPWEAAMAVGSDKLLMASVNILQTWGWRMLFFGAVVAWAWTSVRYGGRAFVLRAALIAIALLVPAYSIGFIALRRLEARYPARQPVALIQGNIGNYEKKLTKLGVFPTIRNVMAVHRELIEKTAIHHSYETAETWTVWPETSYPGFLHRPSDRSALEEWTKLVKGVQIIGAYETASASFAGKDTDLDYNVVALFHEKAGYVARYQKRIRLPFGEYIPGDEWFPNLYELLPAVPHFGKGLEYTGLPHPNPEGPVFVPLVCYEILYADFLAEFVTEARNKYPGRELILVNPTNDSWYGPTSEPFQHSLLGRWQVAKVGLPMLRPTNTGLSQVIAPWGEVLATGPQDESTVIFGQLPVQRVTPRF
jgi:apolipoprotein N-acyltransferase